MQEWIDGVCDAVQETFFGCVLLDLQRKGADAELAECKTLEPFFHRVFLGLGTVIVCRSVTSQAGNSYAPLQPRSAVILRAVPCLSRFSSSAKNQG